MSINSPYRSDAQGGLVGPPPSWVISDTHFYHDNIIKYCPWRATWAFTIRQHNDMIISHWNKSVAPNDWVLHLGDFALCDRERLSVLRTLLRGRIILVHGNHDYSHAVMAGIGIEHICSRLRIEDGSGQWVCRHNPGGFTADEVRQSTRLLHGHCHGNGYSDMISKEVVSKARDCSMDALREYGPVPWSSVA